jgi:cytochrome P450
MTLSLLIQILSRNSATEKSVEIEELVDDFVTFFTAGQEITASMLTFALVLTLQHPNVLER